MLQVDFVLKGSSSFALFFLFCFCSSHLINSKPLDGDFLSVSLGKKTSRRDFKLIRNPLLSLCPRASDQYPWWHGNRPVWNDWPADVHPGGGNRPRHGPPGTGLRPHHTWPQPQLAWVRVAHANAIYSRRRAASLKFFFFLNGRSSSWMTCHCSHTQTLSLSLSLSGISILSLHLRGHRLHVDRRI